MSSMTKCNFTENTKLQFHKMAFSLEPRKVFEFVTGSSKKYPSGLGVNVEAEDKRLIRSTANPKSPILRIMEVTYLFGETKPRILKLEFRVLVFERRE